MKTSSGLIKKVVKNKQKRKIHSSLVNETTLGPIKVQLKKREKKNAVKLRL